MLANISALQTTKNSIYNISQGDHYIKLFVFSNTVLEYSSKINIFSTLIMITVGLVGNSLTLFVFGQSKFRTNPSHVYLLCLAVNDSLFLIIHFFEGKS